MNISSVIVIPHPDHIEHVRLLLEKTDGIEVHAVSPEGKMVITLETEGDRETSGLFEQIGKFDGVLSASMVYHQNEPAPEQMISVQA